MNSDTAVTRLNVADYAVEFLRWNATMEQAKEIAIAMQNLERKE